MKKQLLKKLHSILIFLSNYRLFKYYVTGKPWYEVWLISQAVNIKIPISTFIDVGAFRGQFTEAIRTLFRNVNCILFEPDPKSYQYLKTKYPEPEIKVFNYAAGCDEKEVHMNISSNHQRSTLLELNEFGNKKFGSLNVKEKHLVNVKRIDKIINNSKDIWLKIDAEGFEYNVLNGAKGIFPYINVIIIEVSIKKLYPQQKCFEEIFELLSDQFFYGGNLHQRQINDEIIQIDSIFYNKKYC